MYCNIKDEQKIKQKLLSSVIGNHAMLGLSLNDLDSQGANGPVFQRESTGGGVVDRHRDDLLYDIEVKKMAAENPSSTAKKGTQAFRRALDAATAEKDAAITAASDFITKLPLPSALLDSFRFAQLSDAVFSTAETEVGTQDVLKTPAIPERLDTMIKHVLSNKKAVGMKETLRRHIFKGESMRTGEGVTDTATGLHAYTQPDTNANTGYLPSDITPIGHVGSRERVHLLLWRKGDEEKWSSMMPMNMPQRVSEFLLANDVKNIEGYGEAFEVSSRGAGSDATHFPISREIIGLDEKLNPRDKNKRNKAGKYEYTLQEIFMYLAEGEGDKAKLGDHYHPF